MSALLMFLIAVLIICGICFVAFWAIDNLLPAIAYPAKIIIGLIAVIAIIYKAMPLLS